MGCLGFIVVVVDNVVLDGVMGFCGLGIRGDEVSVFFFVMRMRLG